MRCKKKKRLRYLLVFILMLFLPVSISSAKEIPDHDSNYYIDELNILSEDTKRLINKQDFQGGEQMFVLTVDNMDEDPQDYAVRAFEKYKLGAKGKDNGLLILLARTSQGKHHVWVTTGYGLEDILPDGKVGRIIDNYMMDYFRDGNLDAGINSGFRVFKHVVESRYLPVEENLSEDYDAGEYVFHLLLSFCLLTILIGMGGFLFSEVIPEKRRKRKISQIDKMTYNDFLKQDDKYDSSYNSDYLRKLEYLSPGKNSQTIKRDMNKALTYKNFFNSIYQNKKAKELSQEDLGQLIRDADSCEDIDDTIYKEVIDQKVSKLESSTLISYMRSFSRLSTFYILEREYTSRKRKELNGVSFKELDKIRQYGEDEFLRKDSLKELANEVMNSKLRKLKESELNKEKEKATSDDLRLKIIEEKRRREKEQEEERRRKRAAQQRRSSSSSSSSSSWSSGSSSSFGGGFSGGGGMTGGGGAGRSF